MPEGPEVTIIAEGLNKELKNKLVTNFEINDKSRYKNKVPIGYNDFMLDVLSPYVNVKIKSVNNKGKLIYWVFTNGWILLQTLGMSGGWFHHSKKHSGVILSFMTEIKSKIENKLYFDDQRHFATFKFLHPDSGEKELNLKLKTIGPDILNDNSFKVNDFILILKKKNNQKRLINKVLVDQKTISGIGNYLRSEILYHAKINPHRLVNTLTDNEMKQLFKSSKLKIIGSFNTGGASIRHYSDIDDKKGLFEFKMEVYGKKKDKLGNTVKSEKIQNDGQTTYWVPNVQI